MKFFNTISGMRSLQKVFIKSSLLACLFGCSGAFADSVDSLSLFLKSTRSMRADLHHLLPWLRLILFAASCPLCPSP